MQRLWRLYVWLFLGLLPGCLTWGTHSPEEPAASAPDVSGLRPGGIDCSRKPTARVCCEALTPACNECRDREQSERLAWRQQCLKPGTPPPSCAGAPPVVNCCADGGEECEDCREEALNQLLAWKQTCADEDLMSCDAAPSLSPCCDSLIPSCAACRDRNHRISEEWVAHCNSHSVSHEAHDTHDKSKEQPSRMPPAAIPAEAQPDAAPSSEEF